jgi:putative ABC transport system permease protein
MQTIMLANIGGMFTMMGGGEISSEDVKNSAIRALGGNDIANSISIYPVDFDNKDMVTNYLTKWNEDGDITVGEKLIKVADRQDVEYTDTLSLVIDLINNMIDIISYALIAFTSVSLVVSTVMIGIITYVSVVERIKEIGVIRSLGGRKRDVSNLFNAETLMIGMSSGLIGIGFTYLLSLIVNVIVRKLAGLTIMLLPIPTAIIMVLLSTGLTVLSGLIPAKKAAQQDPVVALRTE